MKIVLTGATGLIGGALGRKLVADGHELTALVRDLKTHVNFPCRKFVWDGEKDQAPVEALKGAEIVYHLAGENIAAKRWTAARKRQLVDSRVKSAKNLKQGLESAGVKRLKLFVTASGAGYYGDRQDEDLKEDAKPGTDFLAKLCQQWEGAAHEISAERHVEARFGVVMSAQGGFLRQVAPLFTMVGASPLGNGEQYFSWIHIDDLVSALILMLTDETLHGPVNTASSEPVRNSRLTEDLRVALQTFSSPAVPSVALKVLYGELSEALLFSQKLVPEKLLKAGFKFKFPTLPQAFAEIYGDLEIGEMKVVFEHWLKAPLNEVWEFFSSENNLERLTPGTLNFKVLGKSTSSIQAGTLIDYQLKLRGIPMHWRTLISEWKERHHFVDEQLKGPYTKWHHRHEFSAFAGGTMMRDTVRFKVPCGWLGRLASLPLVMKEVEGIFAYRTKAIDQIFSSH